MSIEKISERDVARTSMEGVANRPNDRTGFGNSGMTPQQLKERHSALAKLAIGKLNEVIEAFGNDGRESELLSLLYTALEDEHDMSKKMTLAAWIERIEQLVARGTPLDAGKVWTATESGAGAWKDPPPGIPGKDGADGADGADGTPGKDGFSPTVAVEKIEGGHRVTVTDAKGDRTFVVPDGAKGATGDPFRVAKTYKSVALMNAGFATDGVPEGGFVLIATGSVEDADNAKLFVKGETGYQYLIDLSGATGIQGEAGSSIKSIAKTGTSGLVDTYTITLTDGSTFTFTVKNGADGKDGADGSGGGGGTTVTVGGAAVDTFDADTKLDKVNVSSGTKIYAAESGKQTTKWASTAASGGYIPIRASGGQIVVPNTPSGDSHATSKKYVDAQHDELLALIEASGEGGGGEPCLKTTTLFDGFLGILEPYQNIFTGYLSDKIRPNTKYLINDIVRESDSWGEITTGPLRSYDEYNSTYIDYTLHLYDNIIELIADDADYNYGEYVIPVAIKVVGLASFTAVANSITTYQGPNNEFSAIELPKGKALTLYLGYNDLIRTYLVNEKGSLVDPNIVEVETNGIKHQILYPTGNRRDFSIAVSNWVLTVGKPTHIPYKTYMISIENQDAASSGGGSKFHAVAFMNPYSEKIYQLDISKSYLVRATTYDMGDVYHKYYVFYDGRFTSLNLHSSYGEDTPPYFYCYVDYDILTVRYDGGDRACIEVTEITDFYDTTCFIEGTEVLLRDPDTLETYSKKIEDVLPFEYAAYWSPEKGRLTATRIVAPPIIGECTEYDRLSFSDGKRLDVFGVQFFWNVDEDRLQNWAEMPIGTRVCTSEGDIITYEGSEHIQVDTPVRHVTLVPFMGRYIAGGIQVGDKRELILPLLLKPNYLKYYRMLSEKDQESLKKAHISGMSRRNRKYSKEYVMAQRDYDMRRKTYKDEQSSSEKYLSDTDYQVSKLAEGILSEEEFAPTRAIRAEKRNSVNRCRDAIRNIDAEKVVVLREIEERALNTYKPKYKGKFAGKTRAVLEET